MLARRSPRLCRGVRAGVSPIRGGSPSSPGRINLCPQSATYPLTIFFLSVFCAGRHKAFFAGEWHQHRGCERRRHLFFRQQKLLRSHRRLRPEAPRKTSRLLATPSVVSGISYLPDIRTRNPKRGGTHAWGLRQHRGSSGDGDTALTTMEHLRSGCCYLKTGLRLHGPPTAAAPLFDHPHERQPDARPVLDCAFE